MLPAEFATKSATSKAGSLYFFSIRQSAQGRLVFHMFGALAEFERSLIRERTQAGLAAARRAGRTGGRPPKLTDDDIEAAKALLANPDIGVTQIAHRLGVSPATLYRYIPAARTANTPGAGERPPLPQRPGCPWMFGRCRSTPFLICPHWPGGAAQDGRLWVMPLARYSG
jgi:hypothetical protein